MDNMHIKENLTSFVNCGNANFYSGNKLFRFFLMALPVPVLAMGFAITANSEVRIFMYIQLALLVAFWIIEVICLERFSYSNRGIILLHAIPLIMASPSGLIIALVVMYEIHPIPLLSIFVVFIYTVFSIILYKLQVSLARKGNYNKRNSQVKGNVAVCAALGGFLGYFLPPIIFSNVSQQGARIIVFCAGLAIAIIFAQGFVILSKFFFAKKYDIVVVPTWSVEEGKELYEWVGYPFKFKYFTKLTSSQAEQFFNWHMEKKEWRMNHLQEFVNETSDTAINLDYSSDSLVPLWEWFEKRIFMKDARLEFTTRIIAMDVAIYLAETLIRSQSDVEWSYITEVDDKRLVNRPILIGFPNGAMFEPYQAVTELALKSRKEKYSTRLFELYNEWAM